MNNNGNLKQTFAKAHKLLDVTEKILIEWQLKLKANRDHALSTKKAA